MTQIALTGSVYTMVAVTVERFVSCCFPHVPPRAGAAFSAKTIAAIVAFSVAFNVTRFLEWEAGGQEVGST